MNFDVLYYIKFDEPKVLKMSTDFLILGRTLLWLAWQVVIIYVP